MLYIVGTPIGNLQDITMRALEVLGEVGTIACEDTRVTRKLLARYSITKPLISLHHHSEASAVQEVVELLQKGQAIAYVSDAGTPGVADPGGKLVAAAVAAGVRVVPIPGVSAVTAALSVAGINIQSYLFLGFPPHKKGRQTFFKQAVACKYPVVFFESTHRIVKALTELEKLVPERQVIVGRELTKMFETIYRGSPADVLAELKKTTTKGEFTVIVDLEKK